MMSFTYVNTLVIVPSVGSTTSCFAKLVSVTWIVHAAIVNHLTGKRHRKLERRNSLPPSKPIEVGDADYYVYWPPRALDSSSPIPGVERRTRVTAGLNLISTMSRWTPCTVCKQLIGFSVLCWETKPCGHLIHEACHKRRFGVSCEHCSNDRIFN